MKAVLWPPHRPGKLGLHWPRLPGGKRLGAEIDWDGLTRGWRADPALTQLVQGWLCLGGWAELARGGWAGRRAGPGGMGLGPIQGLIPGRDVMGTDPRSMLGSLLACLLQHGVGLCPENCDALERLSVS